LHSGDPHGIEDLEQGVAIVAHGHTASALPSSQENLASGLWEQGQLERASALREEAEESSCRFGQIAHQRWCQGEHVVDQFVLGRWDEALAGADAFLAVVEAGSPHYFAPLCYVVRAQVRLGRDDLPRALIDAERALELARLAKDPQIYSSLSACGYVFLEGGSRERARLIADELLAELRAGSGLGSVLPSLHILSWTLTALGRAEMLIDTVPSAENPWIRAALAFAAGDLREAADVCAAMGAATEEARDRLWLAEALIDQGHRAEADVELGRALAFYRSVGATRYIREAEGLLAASA
jgi:tetratricopeptide (TPR) repeat protein